MIVLDTSALSRIFRRRVQIETPQAIAFRDLVIRNQPIGLPGIVLQEVLSGVRSAAQSEVLRRNLAGLRLLLASAEDHRSAADVFNLCQGKGISANSVDCLIAATALGLHARLWTYDDDFDRIARVCALQIFQP